MKPRSALLTAAVGAAALVLSAESAFAVNAGGDPGAVV
jgi:hypothetical protein